ncbi:GNAT family N-acetyltransferase [Rhizobium sp. OAE497]|uniref:GNAT family N-acetyltransferase n=1 Tax=Rhizobium sp. OAE497 TaxID=2663796 RepID=UPI0033991147
MEIRLTVRENVLADPNKVTPDDYRWFVRNPGIFVWEEDGGIHGFAAADTRNGNIWALFVDQAYCGRGVGRALLSSVCSVLRTAGFEKAWLTTDPNTRAERFLSQGRLAACWRARQRAVVRVPALAWEPSARFAFVVVIPPISLIPVLVTGIQCAHVHGRERPPHIGMSHSPRGRAVAGFL